MHVRPLQLQVRRVRPQLALRGSDDRAGLGSSDNYGALYLLQLRRHTDRRRGSRWRRRLGAMVSDTGMTHILHADIPMAPVGRIA
jgi:hypothetical protein